MPSAPPHSTASTASHGTTPFRPRLTLQTLTRGDGLLGLRALSGFGPRSAQVTVAQVDWTYLAEGGLHWETPAPERVTATRPKPTHLIRGAWGEHVTIHRDLRAEADASDLLWSSGLRPLPSEALQWRTRTVAEGHEHLWSLIEESHFGDFWADQVPRLQAQGWSIVVRPGFAHQSVPVDAWKFVIDPVTGDETGRELTHPLGPRPRNITAMRQPPRQAHGC